jgi:hypothetical protein
MPFDEDQRIVIRTLAAEEAAKQLKDSTTLVQKVDSAIDAKLPKVSKLEKLLGSWWGIVGLVLAVPFASAGVTVALRALLDKGVETYVQSELDKEDGPVKSTLKSFSQFRGRLSEQFSQSVDSATSKLLRFGCNLPSAISAVEGFPSCAPRRVNDNPSIQARNVQEINDQTIVFKANENQRVLLRLRLSPVDTPEELRRVGLRLQTPPLLALGGSESDKLVIEKRDLPDTHDFVHEKSGLLQLYGAVSDRSAHEPLHVDIELTRHLRKKTDLHALRFRAETIPGEEPAAANRGIERFYLHAIVIVTHNLPKE